MIIVPQRSLPQRALNRMLHPFGIKPFPIAFESTLAHAGSDPQSVFDAVYAANYWSSPESKSGPGSELSSTEKYREQLVVALRELEITSMFDAPCGDLNWMSEVLKRVRLRYIGGDVAAEAIQAARARCPELEIRHFDICSGDFPAADLWHCRDTLFHLSFDDIYRALSMAKKAEIKFAAITTHKAIMLRNLDIKTGGGRLLDLERPPFNFPKPLRYLRDFRLGEFPRFVGIWRLPDLPG